MPQGRASRTSGQSQTPSQPPSSPSAATPIPTVNPAPGALTPANAPPGTVLWNDQYMPLRDALTLVRTQANIGTRDSVERSRMLFRAIDFAATRSHNMQASFDQAFLEVFENFPAALNPIRGDIAATLMRGRAARSDAQRSSTLANQLLRFGWATSYQIDVLIPSLFGTYPFLPPRSTIEDLRRLQNQNIPLRYVLRTAELARQKRIIDHINSQNARWESANPNTRPSNPQYNIVCHLQPADIKQAGKAPDRQLVLPDFPASRDARPLLRDFPLLQDYSFVEGFFLKRMPDKVHTQQAPAELRLIKAATSKPESFAKAGEQVATDQVPPKTPPQPPKTPKRHRSSSASGSEWRSEASPTSSEGTPRKKGDERKFTKLNPKDPSGTTPDVKKRRTAQGTTSDKAPGTSPEEAQLSTNEKVVSLLTGLLMDIDPVPDFIMQEMQRVPSQLNATNPLSNPTPFQQNLWQWTLAHLGFYGDASTGKHGDIITAGVNLTSESLFAQGQALVHAVKFKYPTSTAAWVMRLWLESNRMSLLARRATYSGEDYIRAVQGWFADTVRARRERDPRAGQHFVIGEDVFDADTSDGAFFPLTASPQLIDDLLTPDMWDNLPQRRTEPRYNFDTGIDDEVDIAPGYLSGETIYTLMRLLIRGHATQRTWVTPPTVFSPLFDPQQRIGPYRNLTQEQADAHTNAVIANRGLDLPDLNFRGNIAIPINVRGNHWVLAFILRMDINHNDIGRDHIFIMDSMGDRQTYSTIQHTLELWMNSRHISRYAGFEGRPRVWENVRSQLQTNGYDCGIFVIENARYLENGRGLGPTPNMPHISGAIRATYAANVMDRIQSYRNNLPGPPPPNREVGSPVTLGEFWSKVPPTKFKPESGSPIVSTFEQRIQGSPVIGSLQAMRRNPLGKLDYNLVDETTRRIERDLNISNPTPLTPPAPPQQGGTIRSPPISPLQLPPAGRVQPGTGLPRSPSGGIPQSTRDRIQQPASGQPPGASIGGRRSAGASRTGSREGQSGVAPGSRLRTVSTPKKPEVQDETDEDADK